MNRLGGSGFKKVENAIKSNVKGPAATNRIHPVPPKGGKTAYSSRFITDGYRNFVTGSKKTILDTKRMTGSRNNLASNADITLSSGFASNKRQQDQVVTKSTEFLTQFKRIDCESRWMCRSIQQSFSTHTFLFDKLLKMPGI
jgi:hypothetical protein